ncbi:MAG: hypothetical protein CSA62_12270 [Planctomycetota bacterium]|nr:MAG: hypothetical protein CSA62_12270 [Planctomycetota bacterium]
MSPKGARALSALLALASGFATMGAELAAVRVLAPSFGDSAPVWTNVIAVMLLALALGAWLGGIFADRGLARRVLIPAFSIAAALLALAPYLASWLSQLVLPDPLPLDLALGVMIRGSLAVGLLVFAPPILLLGMASPCLIKLSCAENSQIGRASGSVYAFGTLGSLAGTFLATHVLVPSLGLRASFGLFAIILFGCALSLAFAGGKRSRSYLLLLLLPLAASPCLLLDAGMPAWLAQSGYRLLEMQDSRYQRLWVLEGREKLASSEGGHRGEKTPQREARIRLLAINEGADSYHSVRIEGEALSNGRYYDAFALLPALLPATRLAQEQPIKVLSIGCATGALLRAVDHAAGQKMQGIGVELDPVVLELGRRFFDSPGREHPRIQLIGGIGGRLYVERCASAEAPFDLILLDAYRHQIYVPPQLASVEFFHRVRELLSEDGILAMNIGELPQGGPVLPRVAGTAAAVFESVESLQLPRQRNALLLAHSGSCKRLLSALRSSQRPQGLSPGLWKRAQRDGAWRCWDPLPEGERLSDDRSQLLDLHETLYRSERP